MSPLRLFDELSPYARVATAVAPFAAAMVLRVLLGKGRLTGMLVSVSTVWFAINILLAPYSAGMRQDLQRIENVFR
jgi:hypothetical protein